MKEIEFGVQILQIYVFRTRSKLRTGWETYEEITPRHADSATVDTALSAVKNPAKKWLAPLFDLRQITSCNRS